MSDMNYTGKQYYLAIWKSVLGALLKWPEKQVMNWVGERGLWEFLDNPDDMLYHETPQYWITTLLIPDK